MRIKKRIKIIISVIVAMIFIINIWFSEIPESVILNRNSKDIELHLIDGVGLLYGYADIKGSIKIRPKFFEAHEFSDGLAVVRNINGFGYIDKSGKMVIKSKYKSINDFHEGVAVVFNGEDHPSTFRYGVIDKEGKEIIPLKYKHINNFSEGLAVMYDEDFNKYGYIDKTGKKVIDSKFDEAHDFKNGIAYVKIDGKTYSIKKNGEY